MRRTRRRQRGTWLPNIGTSVNGEQTLSGRTFTLVVPADGSNLTAVTPLTFDIEHGDDADAPDDFSMADVIGSEYTLDRIVGKCYAARFLTNSTEASDAQPAVLFSCGFFVARANDSGSGGGVDTPIGSASVAERRDNYSPLDIDTVREPWIWRRTWILGAALRAQGSPNNGVAGMHGFNATFPCSTALYGSVADGPHIDSKVKRRVAQDNRLWFVTSLQTFPINSTISTGVLVHGYLDYRLFGRLRRARQTSAF